VENLLPELFFELFSGLPRQGPGLSECTRRALSLIPVLGPQSWVADIGCGTGAQTLDLAAMLPSRIVAIDAHPPFVNELKRQTAEFGLRRRLHPVVGDMIRLGLAARRFDLVWSEGAVYIMGFDAGLRIWRELLTPGGHLAVSELSWTASNPPRECAEYFASEYPAMRGIAENRAAARRCGYEVVGDFPLPPSGWWDSYYEPLRRRIDEFTAAHPGNAAAEAIVAASEREIEVYREYFNYYSYVFYVLRKLGE